VTRDIACVNCGAPAAASHVCEACGSDPALANDRRDQVLRGRTAGSRDDVEELLASAAEDRALLVSISVVAVSMVVLSILTLGVFLLVILVSVIAVLLSRRAARASFLRVQPGRMSVLHQLSLTAAFRLRLKPVDVFVQQSPEFNAYTSGFGGRSWIVMDSGLVEAMTPMELLFVLGHEMGHVKLRHVFWKTVVGDGRHSFPLLSPILRLVFSGWSRACEYSADRAGLIATRTPGPCFTALGKLAAGPGTVRGMRPDEVTWAFAEEEDTLLHLAEMSSSHPFISRRVKAILDFWKIIQPRPIPAGNPVSHA
jgi:Zn-dependent protease with chaperone function